MRRLLLYGRWLGAPLEQAEDLVHDALKVVVEDPDWYRPERGNLVSALKVILRNRYLNQLRDQGVRRRTAPKLTLVESAPGPDAPLSTAEARDNRHQLLALLDPGERRLFAVWLQQRDGVYRGSEAADQLGMTHRQYEAGKKRLRRRCAAILEELSLTPAELFDPRGGPS